jgi:hypothetical protein
MMNDPKKTPGRQLIVQVRRTPLAVPESNTKPLQQNEWDSHRLLVNVPRAEANAAAHDTKTAPAQVRHHDVEKMDRRLRICEVCAIWSV